MDLLTETTWSFGGASRDAAFSGGSGKTMDADGTRAARSGGLSFPTGGLACEELKIYILHKKN